MLHPGLYEQVINQKLDSELSDIPEARQSTAPIDKAEASKVLAQYLSEVVQQGLDNVVDNGGDLSAQIALTNQIVSGLPLTLANFANYYRLDIRTIFSKHSFSRLCVAAGVREDFDEPMENALTKALGRISAIDSRRWIRFLLNILPNLDNVDFGNLKPIEKRMLLMFYVTVWLKSAERWDSEEVLDNLYALSDSPVMLAELKLKMISINHYELDDALRNLKR